MKVHHERHDKVAFCVGAVSKVDTAGEWVNSERRKDLVPTSEPSVGRREALVAMRLKIVHSGERTARGRPALDLLPRLCIASRRVQSLPTFAVRLKLRLVPQLVATSVLHSLLHTLGRIAHAPRVAWVKAVAVNEALQLVGRPIIA